VYKSGHASGQNGDVLYISIEVTLGVKSKNKKDNKMKLWFTVVAVLIVCAVLWASGWARKTASGTLNSSDAAKAASNNYKVRYEDAHVRLVEVVVRPSETEKMHTDPYALVIASDAVAPAKLKDTANPNAGHGPAPQGADYPFCETRGAQDLHAITNSDTFPLHYYRIEFKRIDGDAYKTNWQTWYRWMLDPLKPVRDVQPPSDAKPFSQEFPFPIAYDSYIAAPNNHYMRYQDAHVRFLEVTFRAGERENLHGHPYASVFAHDTGGAAGAAAQPPATADGPLAEAGFHRKPDGAPRRTSVGDIKLDPNSPLNGQGGGQGPAPAGMQWPTCNTMVPQAPHKAYNGNPYPTHFYRIEFKRIDGEGIKTHWKQWYPWMGKSQ